MSEKESILVFLSYSSKDKDLAGKIKLRLETFGIEAFLAHEDIKPTQKWKDVILDHLERCDVFIPIVSKNFKQSNWTDQETGYALGTGKMIIPIGTDEMPYGFIEDTQAVTTKDTDKVCTSVFDLINEKFANPVSWRLIKSIEESEGFYETNDKIELLTKCGNLTIDQIERLLEAFVSNNQVSGAWRAKAFIRGILEKGIEFEDPDLDSRVRELLE